MSKERQWSDPVKNKPPRKETLDVKGNFQEFTDLMRRIAKKSGEPTPPASPDAAVSDR